MSGFCYGLSGYDPSRPVATFEDDRPTRPRTLRRARIVTAVCSTCNGTGLRRTRHFGAESCKDCDGLGINKEDS